VAAYSSAPSAPPNIPPPPALVCDVPVKNCIAPVRLFLFVPQKRTENENLFEKKEMEISNNNIIILLLY